MSNVKITPRKIPLVLAVFALVFALTLAGCDGTGNGASGNNGTGNVVDGSGSGDNGTGTTPAITIVAQPAPTTNVVVGNISGNLTVAASVTGGATLSYQWFSNTTDSNVGGTAIDGATTSVLSIPPDLAVGRHYYFVEVRASGAESVRSAVATVNVTPPVITICDYGDCECVDCDGATCDCETAACYDCDCDVTGNCTGSHCFCGALRIEVVRVEGGSFEMGSCPIGPSVTPIRTVTVSGFYMGVFPVTQGEWYDAMGVWPSRFTGTNAIVGWDNVIDPVTPVFNRRNLPVERVSWFDAVAFANALSAQAGLDPAYTINGTTVTWNRYANGYRLPTEAEWEFAARGGIVCQGNFAFSGSATAAAVAWTSENSGGRTREVGSLMPNALGLYDMSGNVAEWVWDRWGTYPSVDETDPTGPVSGSGRVVRGGSWRDTSVFTRSAHRGTAEIGLPLDNLGFRLVRP